MLRQDNLLESITAVAERSQEEDVIAEVIAAMADGSFDQLDELSKETLANYIRGAGVHREIGGYMQGSRGYDKSGERMKRTLRNRGTGTDRALDRLTDKKPTSPTGKVHARKAAEKKAAIEKAEKEKSRREKSKARRAARKAKKEADPEYQKQKAANEKYKREDRIRRAEQRYRYKQQQRLNRDKYRNMKSEGIEDLADVINELGGYEYDQLLQELSKRKVGEYAERGREDYAKRDRAHGMMTNRGISPNEGESKEDYRDRVDRITRRSLHKLKNRQKGGILAARKTGMNIASRRKLEPARVMAK